MSVFTSVPAHLLEGHAMAKNERSAAVSQMHRRLIMIAGIISATFVLATGLAHLIYREGTAALPGFELYDVDSEANLPSWYASTLLQACAFLAFVISFHDAPEQKNGWRGIALLLLLMGMDEVAGLHNVPSRRLSEVIGLGNGYLMNACVIPASGVLAILGLTYLPFIKRLPGWLLRSLIGAAAAYVIGALALEVLGSGFEYEAGGLNYDGVRHYSFSFEMTAVLEEAFEYVGVLATMAAFLRHAQLLNSRLFLDFTQTQLLGNPGMASSACREREPSHESRGGCTDPS
jgi:hypothetical protein